MKYFEHDVTAHKDDKIILLRKVHGGAAVDAYWTLLEIIYRNEKPIKTNQKPLGLASVSFFLQVEETTLQEWIDTMCELGLFSKEEDSEDSITLCSPRAEANIESYKERSEASRTNGRKGGRPKKTPVQDANKTQQKPSENLWVSETETYKNLGVLKTKPSENLEKPSRGEKEKEKEKYKEDISNDISKKDPDFPLIVEIVDYLNAKANTSYRSSTLRTRRIIKARLKEGFTVQDFKDVIDGRIAAWANDPKMSEYIRPETLFGSKFEGYLNASKPTPKSEKETKLDETFRKYDEYSRQNGYSYDADTGLLVANG